MAQIWEYIKIALMNIRSNRARSFLTMLGIIIGISSVIMVVAVGRGVSKQMEDELNSIGGGQLYIYTDTKVETDLSVSFAQEDFELILEKVPYVKAVTPSISSFGTGRGPKGEFDAYVTAGNEGLEYASSDPLVKGRYFTKSDVSAANRVCVISESSARALFGTSDVVGLSFEMTVSGISQEMTVAGIRQDSTAALISAGTEETTLQMEMPHTTLEHHFQISLGDITSFLVVSQSNQHSAEVAAQAVRLLENRYHLQGMGKLKIENFADLASQINEIMDIITLFLSFVAAISLLVGGIGVMNIMLVSVTERTREIGIRRALGAKTGSILLQFLAEAASITLLGGVIGILLGVGGARLIGALAGVEASLSFRSVVTATLFSSGIGIFFGIYPARKAARLSPIEALRRE